MKDFEVQIFGDSRHGRTEISTWVKASNGEEAVKKVLKNLTVWSSDVGWKEGQRRYVINSVGLEKMKYPRTYNK